ncbi:MAG: DUF4175 family protein [Pseudomonadota bacterium]
MEILTDIPGLRAQLARTRGRLGRLALLRAFAPALVFAFAYLSAALLGALEQVSPVIAAGLCLSALLVFALLVVRGLRRYQPVPAMSAERALDRQSKLRPLSGLADRPARPTPEAQRLWQAHTKTLRAEAASLKAPTYSAAWRQIDPAFLRFALPAILIGALVFAGADRAGRLQQALLPNLGALAGADALRVEAWVTPPAHTRRPPIFLEAGMDDVRIPAGSKVTLRAFHRAAPSLVLSGDSGRSRQRFLATPDGAFEAEATLGETTRLSVHWWGERAAWTFLASPDSAPSVRFVTLPAITTTDEMEFEWAAEDDFGIERLQLAIRLRTPHPAAPDAEDRLAIPMGPVSPREAEETVKLETMRHRWAGLEVDVQLVATDGAGQEGRSRVLPFVLPEKLLLQPLARAAQEIRVTVLREPRGYDDLGDLGPGTDALDDGRVNAAATHRLDAAPEDVRLAAGLLDALTLEPERYFEDRSVYFGLRMAHGILASAPSKSDADSVDTLLWQVALKAEYGSSADALRALLAARRALEQALRDGASEDEIRRLMEAFREAANNYIAAKMAEAFINGTEAPNMTDMGPQGGGGGLGANQFEDMLNTLEDLAETGASDQARQLLSDITNMLENLEFQQGGSGGGDGFAMPGEAGEGDSEEGDLPEEEQELTDALEALSDLLREQRELNDDTLAENRGEGSGAAGPEGPPGQQGAEGGQEGETGAGDGLGTRQRNLAQRTGRLGRGEAPGDEEGSGAAGGAEDEDGAGNGAGGPLDEAARDRLGNVARLQDRAAGALERGDQRLANRLQERATGELRDLSEELAAALDALQEMRRGDLASEESDQRGLDPFGRPIGGTGDGGDVTVPENAERQRAKDILDELRRRFDDSETEEEREYLERLLDRF